MSSIIVGYLNIIINYLITMLILFKLLPNQYNAAYHIQQEANWA